MALVLFASVHPIYSGMNTYKRDEYHAPLISNFLLTACSRRVELAFEWYCIIWMLLREKVLVIYVCCIYSILENIICFRGGWPPLETGYPNSLPGPLKWWICYIFSINSHLSAKKGTSTFNLVIIILQLLFSSHWKSLEGSEACTCKLKMIKNLLGSCMSVESQLICV